MQLSPDTRHVLGDAGQEGLNLLVQQGLWAPVSTEQSLPTRYTLRAELVAGPSDTRACVTSNLEVSDRKLVS